MKPFFKSVWLGAWGIVLVMCGLIIIAHAVVSHTVLSSDRLVKAADTPALYEALRSDVIAPHIVKAAANTEYRTLVDEPTVTAALRVAFPDETLKTELKPVADGLVRWLDNKSETIDFTVDTKASMSRLSTALTDRITDHIMKAPDCTYLDSYKDLTTGRCKAPFVPRSGVRQVVEVSVNANDSIKSGTLTAEQLGLAETPTNPTVRHIPDYINLLYTANIIAIAVAVIVTLWLILKYRSLGLMTLGAAGVVTAILVLIATQASLHIPQFGAFQTVLESLVRNIKDDAIIYVLPVASAATVVFVGGLLWWYLQRRRAQSHAHSSTLHL